MKEAYKQAKQEITSPATHSPTQLRIISPEITDIDSLKLNFSKKSKFRSKCQKTEQSLSNVLKKLRKSIYILDEFNEDNRTIYEELHTNTILLVNYLNIHRDANKIGASDRDIWLLFKNTIKCQLDAANYIKRLNPEINPYRLVNKVLLNKALNQSYNHGIISFAKPETFNSLNREQWINFQNTHTIFTVTPISDHTDYVLNNNHTNTENFIFPHSYLPDWVNEKNPPEIDTLPLLIEKSLLEQKVIIDQSKDITHQRTYLADMASTKSLKVNCWLIEQIRKEFNIKPKNLAELIIDLNTYVHLQKSPDSILTMTSEEYLQWRQKTNTDNLPTYFNLAIDEFLSSEKIDPSLIGLWLENNYFRKYNQPNISESFSIEDLKHLVQTINHVPADKTTTVTPNQKTLRQLGNQISALVSMEDKAILSSLLLETNNLRVEDLVRFISHYLSNGESTNKNWQIFRKEVDKFSRRWLQQNYEWAYEQLKKELTECKEQEEHIGINESTYYEYQSYLETNPAEFTKEETESIDLGSLHGWTIYYLSNIDSETPKQIDLTQSSLDILEDTISKLSTNKGITFSIGTKSVLNVIMGIATYPSEHEHTRISEIHAGKRYKKVKRDDMRFLYQVDRDKKIMYLSSYHKNQFNYTIPT